MFLSRPVIVVACAVIALAGSLASAAVHAAQPPTTAPGAGAAKTKVALVKVDAAWIRPAVKGQMATGGFMTLTASQPLTLTGFGTSAAGESELHEMAMDGSVMRMRAIESLPLPAGKAVVLRPGAGGQHLMLMGLVKPLKAGDEVRLTLKLRTAGGQNLTQDIKVPVKALQQ